MIYIVFRPFCTVLEVEQTSRPRVVACRSCRAYTVFLPEGVFSEVLCRSPGSEYPECPAPDLPGYRPRLAQIDCCRQHHNMLIFSAHTPDHTCCTPLCQQQVLVTPQDGQTRQRKNVPTVEPCACRVMYSRSCWITLRTVSGG